MYRVSRCADSPEKRKLKGCSTWSYLIVETKEQAKQLKKQWKQEGYYVKVEVIENDKTDK